MALAREVVLVDYLRSPFSRSRPKEPDKDLLNGWRMDRLAGNLANEIIKRNKINPDEIDEFIVGTSSPFLETYTGGGRFPYCWVSYRSRLLPSRWIQPAVPLLTALGLPS
jgi:acetyl-CoA acetyltransferase